MYLDPMCPFCRIVSGDQPCCRVFEDALTLAFLVGSPAEPGHCLVIPKAHFADLYVMTDDALAAVMSTARHVARAVQDALAAPELDVIQANRTASPGTVRHFHVNVVPRQTREDIGMAGILASLGGRERELAATIRRRF